MNLQIFLFCLKGECTLVKVKEGLMSHFHMSIWLLSLKQFFKKLLGNFPERHTHEHILQSKMKTEGSQPSSSNQLSGKIVEVRA